MASSPRPTTIDEYIAEYPEPAREILERVRATIVAAASRAVERIAHRMAAFE